MANKANYSRLDRALHKLSFGSAVLQDVLEDIEAGIYADSWKNISPAKPAFITSLPRAGTTIVLEALHRIPGVATHTYRDMPFILTPVLWSKFSSRIRSEGVSRERAHGDGLYISEDSPEAFEEVLWQKFFPQNYSDQFISLWETGSTEFAVYFRTHMQKIISLRYPELAGSRYVSKNNGNVARTAAILGMLPDAKIVVPLRDPIEHAISMWRQHVNFMEQQAEEDFVTRYMSDIGHYEFGSLHRPIRFPGLEALVQGLEPASVDYWVTYWIAAFEFLSNQAGIEFMSYEHLCGDSVPGLTRLCEHLDLDVSAESVAAAASVFRSAPAARKQEHPVDQELVARSNEIYQALLTRCLLQRS